MLAPTTERRRQRRIDAGTIRATSRDVAAMSWVVEMHGLPLDVLRTVAGGMSDAAGRQMLRRWRTAGWVETGHIGSPPMWIWATRLGVERFGRHPYNVSAPSVTRVAHLREVALVRLWIERRVASRNVVWRSERELRWELAASRGSSAARAHLVDGVFEYDSRDGSERIQDAVEVELSPKPFDVVVQNMHTAGQYAHVLWFVNDRTRPIVERARQPGVYASHRKIEIVHLDRVHSELQEGGST